MRCLFLLLLILTLALPFQSCASSLMDSVKSTATKADQIATKTDAVITDVGVVARALSNGLKAITNLPAMFESMKVGLLAMIDGRMGKLDAWMKGMEDKAKVAEEKLAAAGAPKEGALALVFWAVANPTAASGVGIGSILVAFLVRLALKGRTALRALRAAIVGGAAIEQSHPEAAEAFKASAAATSTMGHPESALIAFLKSQIRRKP